MGLFDKINDFFNNKKQALEGKIDEIKVEKAKDKYAYFCGIDELHDNYRMSYNSSFCNFLNKNYDGNKLHQYFMTYEIDLKNMGVKCVDNSKYYLFHDNEKPVEIFMNIGEEKDCSRDYIQEYYIYKHSRFHLASFSADEALEKVPEYLNHVLNELTNNPNKFIAENLTIKEHLVIPEKYANQVKYEHLDFDVNRCDDSDSLTFVDLKLNDFPSGKKSIYHVSHVEEKDGNLEIYFLNDDKANREKEQLEKWVKNPLREQIANLDKFDDRDMLQTFNKDFSCNLIDVKATLLDDRNNSLGFIATDLYEDINWRDLVSVYKITNLNEPLYLHFNKDFSDGTEMKFVVPVVYFNKEFTDDYTPILEVKSLENANELHHEFDMSIVRPNGEVLAVDKELLKDVNLEEISLLLSNIDKKGTHEFSFLPTIHVELTSEEAKGIKYAMSSESNRGSLVFDNLNYNFKAKICCDELKINQDGGIEATIQTMQNVPLKTLQGKTNLTITGKNDILWLAQNNRNTNQVLLNENVKNRMKAQVNEQTNER